MRYELLEARRDVRQAQRALESKDRRVHHVLWEKEESRARFFHVLALVCAGIIVYRITSLKRLSDLGDWLMLGAFCSFFISMSSSLCFGYFAPSALFYSSFESQIDGYIDLFKAQGRLEALEAREEGRDSESEESSWQRSSKEYACLKDMDKSRREFYGQLLKYSGALAYVFFAAGIGLLLASVILAT
jgi:hypothetical protein